MGRGSGTLTWTTNAESDLIGFNVLLITERGSRKVNPTLIVCEKCVTGSGATYAYYVNKHSSGKNFYIEAVHANGTTEIFGPAVRE